ncbi:Putative glycosyltransferase EpsH [Jannaschia seosinensis]|uniref:Putative glycosyltransferase EpsH n=1 Tax=Jannaschia seosinensis TaxID=313367 RepID=A0A0M7BCA3_9RHOB|nr:glycosyltransferase family A protein [Jannaschia seosinensis]CUH38965.1 Putative glycosyltransferase EpsH [Jannaschia seosinensis]
MDDADLDLVRSAPEFDAGWYVRTYRDVLEAETDPALDYLINGRDGDRDPGPGFWARAYLDANPDVADSGIDPFLHYLRFGRAEGRDPMPSQAGRERRAEARVGQWRGEVYVLGYHDRVPGIWEEMAERGAVHFERGMAAFQLALLHLHPQGDNRPAAARRWLDLALRLPATPLMRQRQLPISLVCDARLGRPAPSEAWLEARRERGLIGADALLVRAVFETATDARLLWINRALAGHDIGPVTIGEDAPTPYDGLSAAAAPRRGPLVSVLLAAHNARETLPTAIRSLQAQSWRDLEVIVIDDASSDDTAAQARTLARDDPRIRVIEMAENGGAYVARNAGLKSARGEFVTIHDADDWSHPDKIARQVAHLRDHPEVIGCTSEQARMRDDLSVTRFTESGRLVIDNVSSFMFRRAPVVAALGAWDTVRMSADNELIRRVRRVFGDKSVTHLATGPLSFQRERSNSAIADPILGINGYRFGARKEYYDAQTHFHSTAPPEALRYDGRTRPFPAPRILEGGRRAADLGRFDGVMAGDFRKPVPLATLTAGTERKGRLGAFEFFRPLDVAAGLRMCTESRSAMLAARIQVIVLGERATCDLLALYDPALLDTVLAHLPSVVADRVVLVVPPDGKPGDVAARTARAEAMFGATPIWAGVGKVTHAMLARRVGAGRVAPAPWSGLGSFR